MASPCLPIVSCIPSLQGKKVDVSKLESLVAWMGLNLTQGEMQETLKKATLNSECVSVVSFFFHWIIYLFVYLIDRPT